MDIELERQLIIEELGHVQEEWVLKAIKKLLGLEEGNDIPEAHKEILDARLHSFDTGTAKTMDWEEAKKMLLNKFA